MQLLDAVACCSGDERDNAEQDGSLIHTGERHIVFVDLIQNFENENTI